MTQSAANGAPGAMPKKDDKVQSPDMGLLFKATVQSLGCCSGIHVSMVVHREVCMYIYIYVCTYTYTYTYICVHTYIHIYVCRYIDIDICA